MNVWSRGSGHVEREVQQDAPDNAHFCISNFPIPTIDGHAELGPGFEASGPLPGPAAPGGGQRTRERSRLIPGSLQAFAHSVQSWLQAARCFERSLPALTYSVRLLLQVAQCFAAGDRC
jgi:hypothetical protein